MYWWWKERLGTQTLFQPSPTNAGPTARIADYCSRLDVRAVNVRSLVPFWSVSPVTKAVMPLRVAEVARFFST